MLPDFNPRYDNEHIGEEFISWLKKWKPKILMIIFKYVISNTEFIKTIHGGQNRINIELVSVHTNTNYYIAVPRSKFCLISVVNSP